MAADPHQLAIEAYDAYVKQFDHAPEKAQFLSSFAKKRGFDSVTYSVAKKVLDDPPETASIKVFL